MTPWQMKNQKLKSNKDFHVVVKIIFHVSLQFTCHCSPPDHFQLNAKDAKLGYAEAVSYFKGSCKAPDDFVSSFCFYGCMFIIIKAVPIL